MSVRTRWGRPGMLLLLGLGVLVSLGIVLGSCQWLRRLGVAAFSEDYEQEGNPAAMKPRFRGADRERTQVALELVEVASGFANPTDVQFVPGKPEIMIVLEKGGTARWVSLEDDSRGRWLQMDVLTVSEQGLLGMAFHPRFAENGMLFVNATVEHEGEDVSEISMWRVAEPEAFPARAPERRRTVLRVAQPYQNHNAGQLAFGPDGSLYVGFGDGGYQGDPHGHGQNTGTLLGTMLRLDVDSGPEGKPYGIPEDNPFVGREAFRPEIWAYGLRNPWRYTFDTSGRLWVADVGQNAFEEIDIVRAGDNLGWNIVEGRHCYEDDPRCGREELVAPVYEYGHDEGKSITGGHQYKGTRIPQLANHYVFGDFVSGRLWALPLPEDDRVGANLEAKALGQWSIMPVAFARDPEGEIYVADYGSGSIYRVQAPTE